MDGGEIKSQRWELEVSYYIIASGNVGTSNYTEKCRASQYVSSILILMDITKLFTDDDVQLSMIELF